MPTRTRSMTSLELLVKGGVGGSLRLHSSLPETGSSSCTRTPKRKYSDLSLDLPPLTQREGRMAPARLRSPNKPSPLSIPLNSLSGHEAPPADGDCEQTPPSPAPTEIVDNTPEDYVRTAQAHGVKVRDFVYEPPLAQMVPELWLDPFFTLVLHDQHVRFPAEEAFHLFGRELRRLLDHKLVTEDESKQNWAPLDWQRLDEFDQSSGQAYPYRIAKKRTKPTIAYREWTRKLLFGDRPVLRQDLHIPPDTPELWHGDEETNLFFQQIVRDREAGLPSIIRLRPEGRPGPTQAMRALEPYEDGFTSDTPLIPETPPLSSTELPAAIPTPASSPRPSASSLPPSPSQVTPGPVAEPPTPTPTPPAQTVQLPPVQPQQPQAAAQQNPAAGHVHRPLRRTETVFTLS